jgi:hypothetical protein
LLLRFASKICVVEGAQPPWCFAGALYYKSLSKGPPKVKDGPPNEEAAAADEKLPLVAGDAQPTAAVKEDVLK